MKKTILIKSFLGTCLFLGIVNFAFSAEDVEIKLHSTGGASKCIVQDMDAKTVTSFDSAGNIVTNGTTTIAGSGFSVGGSTFVVKAGNIGIGTTSPATLLDVNGAAQFGSGAAKSTFTAAGMLNLAGALTVANGGTGANTAGGALTNIGAVAKAGDTMAGALTLPADPTAALHAATKQYVDSWTRPCVNPGDANDIMVPVGELCVDKYETSVWSTATGGTQYGSNGAADYPCGNGATGTGQSCTTGGTPIYARSVSGVKPSTSITWFQANIACTNAGKHLLTNAEWQAAAAGTPDPGTGVTTPPGCNVNGSASSVTGANTGCLSGYGVENMVGSVWEWVADWGQYGQISQGTYTAWSDGTSTTSQWPNAAYGADGSWNVAGRSYNGSGWVNGLPAAVFRGGSWGSGASAGVFAFSAYDGPSYWDGYDGFRCGRRR